MLIKECFMSRYIVKKCEWCEKDFPVRTHEIERGHGRFCSRSCSSKFINSTRPKAESPHRLNGIARKIYIERYGPPVCQRCGSFPADVHHKNENRKDNSRKNLLSLCRSCHVSYHNEISPKRQRQQWQEVLSFG